MGWVKKDFKKNGLGLETTKQNWKAGNTNHEPMYKFTKNIFLLIHSTKFNLNIFGRNKFFL